MSDRRLVRYGGVEKLASCGHRASARVVSEKRSRRAIRKLKSLVHGARSARRVERFFDGFVGEKFPHFRLGKRRHSHGDCSRSNRGKQSARLARRNDHCCVVRRFFEKLEKGICGILGAFLKSHALRVANHEDFSFSHRRCEYGLVHDRAHSRDVNAFIARWRGIQSILGHSLRNRLAIIVANVLY